jgi:uncharacterized protein
MTPELTEKLTQLKTRLTNLGSVLVAYSGGTDSSLLLRVAYEVLGNRVLAVTAFSPSLPLAERAEASLLARQIGARHRFLETYEVETEVYAANPPNRCYFCKLDISRALTTLAQAEGLAAVVDGNNADDRGDHRPGRQAARECGLISPLDEVGLTKAEIRTLAQHYGLPNWDKPASACLASRVPYGTRITVEVLAQIEAAEAALRELGLRQVRVRHHGDVARIEAEPDDLGRLLEARATVAARLRALGYTYVTLDLEGFRSGSLNRSLPTPAE